MANLAISLVRFACCIANNRTMRQKKRICVCFETNSQLKKLFTVKKRIIIKKYHFSTPEKERRRTND